MNLTTTAILGIGLLFVSIILLWQQPFGSHSSTDESSTSASKSPAALIVIMVLAAGAIAWITCCGHRGNREREGGTTVHRVYPPGVIALAAILPPLAFSSLGAATYGVVGFISMLILGVLVSFAVLSSINSSPEFGQALLSGV